MSKLSKDVPFKDNTDSKVKHKYQELSDSSSDESLTPSMQRLRTSDLQVKVDKCTGELNQAASSPGKAKLKFKSQRGSGFCTNVLEEKSQERKDIMIQYLSDLMEDDFLWSGAKAVHAGGQLNGRI